MERYQAQGEDGFDVDTLIVKERPTEIDGIVDTLRNRQLEMGVPSSSYTDRPQIKSLVRREVETQARPKRDPSDLHISHTAGAPDKIGAVPPKKCESLITEWLRAHPEDDYETLPCATVCNPGSIHVGGNSGKAMRWRYKMANLYKLSCTIYRRART